MTARQQAERVMASTIRRIASNQMAAPQDGGRESYVRQLSDVYTAVNGMLGVAQSLRVAEALYAAYQLGRLDAGTDTLAPVEERQ